jgi:dolichol-phosphate mannosyltransferase
MPQLSIIMPAYNEECTIAEAIADVMSGIIYYVPDAELIVVNDGSHDRTAEIVSDLQKHNAALTLINQSNQGHGPALRRGMDAATGDWLLLLDSDRQIPLDAFQAHWNARKDFDVYLGLRLPRHDPGFRLIISKLMRMVLKLIVGVAPRDAGAPYKLISVSAWQRASRHIRPGCWIPSVLLASYVLGDRRLRVIEAPIKHRERLHGVSTLNAKRLVRFCWFAMGDILAFRRSLRITR